MENSMEVNPAIPLLGIYLKKIKKYMHPHVYLLQHYLQ